MNVGGRGEDQPYLEAPDTPILNLICKSHSSLSGFLKLHNCNPERRRLRILAFVFHADRKPQPMLFLSSSSVRSQKRHWLNAEPALRWVSSKTWRNDLPTGKISNPHVASADEIRNFAFALRWAIIARQTVLWSSNSTNGCPQSKHLRGPLTGLFSVIVLRGLAADPLAFIRPFFLATLTGFTRL